VGSTKPRRKREARPPPSGLVAYRLDSADDDLVVFEWQPRQDHSVPALSAAERVVLDHVVAGKSNAEIAALRRVSVRTIANQVASLLRKFGVGSRFELISRLSGGTR
jgi:DNA-binding CsgD family transcriptional regulator